MFDSSEDGLAAGTIVAPLNRSLSLEANSAEQAESILCDHVRQGKLTAERVYQICPLIGNSEAIRSVAIDRDGNARRVFLDFAQGRFSEARRIRYPEHKEATLEPFTLQPIPVTA